MPINMASTFSKFVYHKSCVNLLRFQNVYRPSRRPITSLLDLKEKSTGHVEKITGHLFDLHDQCKGQNKAAVLGVCGAETNSQVKRDEDSAESGMSQDVTPLTS